MQVSDMIFFYFFIFLVLRRKKNVSLEEHKTYKQQTDVCCVMLQIIRENGF